MRRVACSQHALTFAAPSAAHPSAAAPAPPCALQVRPPSLPPREQRVSRSDAARQWVGGGPAEAAGWAAETAEGGTAVGAAAAWFLTPAAAKRSELHAGCFVPFNLAKRTYGTLKK